VNIDDVSRKIAEVLEERDPAKFDEKIDEIVGDLVEDNPEGPDFFTVKQHVMGSISRMFDILAEGDE
jgi:hypothetical protein